MEIGLLLLRVVVGALFLGHGTQKLFGWFNGPGLGGASGMFGSLRYRQPRRMAVLAGVSEAGAGLLLVLGLLTPLAAAAIIGVMLNAAMSVHAPNGLWVSNGGYEYNLVLMVVAAALTFTGPGAWALDSALAWSLSGVAWALAAIVVGLVAGAAALALRTAEESPASTGSSERQREDARAG